MSTSGFNVGDFLNDTEEDIRHDGNFSASNIIEYLTNGDNFKESFTERGVYLEEINNNDELRFVFRGQSDADWGLHDDTRILVIQRHRG